MYREVLEECERSETLAMQLLGTIYTTFENQAYCRLPSFLLEILIIQGGCLYSTYLITDLKKYVKELLLHGKSSMVNIMNCPKKDPFCHYIEDELIV